MAQPTGNGTRNRAAAVSLLASALFLAIPARAQTENPSTPILSQEQSAQLDLERQVLPETEESQPAQPTVSRTPPQAETHTAIPGVASEPTDVPATARDLPSGGPGVSPQAAALPTGPSSVLGMGESFTTQLSTGIASFSLPFKLPTARAGTQPALQIGYSSAGGFGIAGKGWQLGAPAISRQSDRGIPKYADQTSWYGEQDRFVFAGMELVPICTAGASCTGLQAGEALPAWAAGWQYFRARVEGGFLRFFWSQDHRSWRVQSKDGVNLEFGVPLDGSGYTGGLEHNPQDSKQIYRWYLVRQYDSEGGVNATASPAPVNAAIYRYTRDGNVVYLTDVFDTPPAAAPTSTDLSRFAHHARVVYEARPDTASSYRAGWLVEYRLRVARVDVTSKAFDGSVTAPRELLRRYHLQYETGSHTSLLTSVQMEGRCPSTVTEQADQTLSLTNCPRLPAMSFEYQRVSGASERLRDANGNAFETFNEKLTALDNSPPYSLDNTGTGLMDLNADGLPDLVVTAAGLFGGKHAVFQNGATPSGSLGFAGRQLLSVEPLNGVDADVLSFDNNNVVPLDLDADGLVNLVHMPAKGAYSVFSPVKSGGNWTWKGRTVTQKEVKIDFTTSARQTRVMDVNGDGLVDVVYSSPSELQTFFALGRYPGGQDQFGHAEWTGAASARISNDPVTACPPWSDLPVRFSDPDVKIADLNGDGLPDIARVRPGQILYWPGRGNGFWGTGARSDCPDGGRAENRHIQMLGAPQFGVTRPGALLMNDVNGDGLSDLVEIRSNGVDIYLNDNGVGWTERHTIENTPFLPSTANFARLTDIDGSGTPDILWGRERAFEYIDLTGGVTPYLLVRVRNGRGATTDFQYATTTEVMRQAAAAGNPWTSFTPTVSPVLVRTTARDHLERVGRPAGTYVTEYTYRDPVFEGRQREFRGFREATVKKLGDATGPSSIQRTLFLLGECSESSPGSPADVCSPSKRWQDNYREPLKGLPAVEESFDEAGTYHSTSHNGYELRQLYTGLDGRRVEIAYPTTKNIFFYDTAAFSPSETNFSLDDVKFTLPDVTNTEKRNVTRRATSGTARARIRSEYDNFGNLRKSIREGCIEGCASVDETITTESVFALAPGDASNWLWRESTSFIVGSIATARRSEVVHTYNAQGKLLTTNAVLSGTLLLDRSHTTPGAPFAPQPPQRSGGDSAPVQVRLVDNTYNQFGQVTFTRSTNNRCSRGELDALYSQLPIKAKKYVGTVAGADGCGATELKHEVTYDRGLEVALTSTDATGQPARFEYDGFGRVLSGKVADPNNPGNLAANPSFTAQYFTPQDPDTTPYSITVANAIDSADFSNATYKTRVTYTDALGRTLVTLSQADLATDGGNWIVEGVTEYNTKGQELRVHDPWFYNEPPETFPLGGPPPAGTPCNPRGVGTKEYDAFGRMIFKYGRDNQIEARIKHHAVSQDIYDALDLASGPEQGTYVTLVSDGHGRAVKRTQRIHVGTPIEERDVINEYLPTGEVTRITQHKAGGTDVVRWLRYDSLGRLVLNAEPNTSPNFNANPSTPPANIKAWRYAYDDSGNMVGFSDARGCGANYHYDLGGRLIAEDRSPCLGSQATYSPPNLSTGDGTEKFYLYDAPDPSAGTITDRNGQVFTVTATFLPGRLASVSGLGSKTVFKYDAHGRMIGRAVKVVKPGVPAVALASRYAPSWYTKTQAFDAIGRATSGTTGLPGNVPQLLSGGTSQVSFGYTKGGRLQSIGSSYGTLFSGGTYLADGRPKLLTLGDAAHTERSYCYDIKKQVETSLTSRVPPAIWTTPPPGSPYTVPPAAEFTTQTTLENYAFSYDRVGNVTGIVDGREPAEWPDKAKPMTRTFEYDDLYRLKRATYQVVGAATDQWKSPYEIETTDPNRTPKPAPHIDYTNRIQEQTFTYDWLGNPQQSTDDQQGFWDRSLGTTTRGSATTGPQRITAASNRTLAPTSPRKGDLSVAYDAAGNATDLIVRRDGTCKPASASCWQRYHYEWNEVGELTHARRFDLVGAERTGAANDIAQPPPTRTAEAELFYTYGPGGERVLKTATAATPAQTVSIFSSLELRQTTWDTAATPPDYVLNLTSINLLVPAGPATARILYTPQSLPMLTSGQRHVYLQLPDQLGSTSFLIDHATGELVERATYQAYGAIESDHRPGRWAQFRDPLRFVGKEEDIEVGLAYFGARYYSPYLTTWLSPDPVTVHKLGSDMNPYAYVRGSPLMGIDPDGREIITAILVGAAIGFVTGYLGSATVQFVTTGHVEWGWANGRGALAAGAVGAVAGAASGGGSEFASWVTSELGEGAVASGARAVFTGLATGAAGGAGSWAARDRFHSWNDRNPEPSDSFEKSLGLGSALGLGFGALEGVAIGLNELDQATMQATQGTAAASRTVEAAMAEGLAVATFQGTVAWASMALMDNWGIVKTSNALKTLGVTMGAVNGAFMGANGAYNWESPSGILAAVSDASTNLVGTSLGNIQHFAGTLSGSVNTELTLRQNRVVYDESIYIDSEYALNFGGTAITNASGPGDKAYPGSDIASGLRRDIGKNWLVNHHESLHSWQSRLMGPLYQVSTVLWFVGGAPVGLLPFTGGPRSTGYSNNPHESMAYANQAAH